MGRRLVILEILVFLLLIFPYATQTVSAETPIQSNSLTLTIYLDGFTQIDQIIELDQSTISFNLSLLSETYQNFLALDENNLPLEYHITGNNAAIYSFGSTEVTISYLTQDLTSKIGQYWTITIDYQERKRLVLPQNASIISINSVPDAIETIEGSLVLNMPSGLTEVTFTAEHLIDENSDVAVEANGFNQGFLVAAIGLALAIPLALSGVWLLKNKTKTKPKPKTDETQDEVDLEKLLSRHRELRQDETQVIRFLASKNGKAFEAELFELLNLPRTTTWRLIRRLEGLEIVYIKKSRRQNIVLIRDKYLIKPKKSH